MNRYKWIVVNKTTGEVITYTSPYGTCSKESVYHSPEVKQWANGNSIDIFPTLQ